MNKKFKCIAALVFTICIYNFAMAQQPISKKQFDELWKKADSTSKIVVKTGGKNNNSNNNNTAKDLNTIERDNIKSVDVKQKTVTNPKFKPIDTSNLELLSTKPIIKGSTSKTKSSEKPNTAIINLEKNKTKDVVKTETKEIVKTKTTESTPVKNTVKYSTDDFSTKPIIKGKSNNTESTNTNTPAVVTKQYNLDTTKGFREFTFETKPIVNNNASYNRRDEPMPKSKEQIDDEIPVNRKPNNTNVEKDNSFVKEAYAQYDKEADSLHTANKRRLDSIMQALNIKVPIVINSTEYVDIYVNGGGTIIDGDSKLSDHISILHTGVVQREYKTKNDGTQRTEKKISKDELTKLAQYIVDMGFFDFKDDYDCADEDDACNQRLTKSPAAVPFSISLTVGSKKNKVSVALFAPKTEKNWVNYPANLEKIMKAIYTIVEK